MILGGEEKKITILFSDLRDFTALSETLEPGELLEVINTYLTAMSQIVDARGGVVDKYIGDAMMALYGVPLEMPDRATRALQTALEMRNALAQLNERTFRPRGYTLGFGIGIHTGLVVTGECRSPERYNYTVIGEYGTDILVSDAALRESGKAFRTRAFGEVSVKGKQQRVLIHALLGPD